VTQRVTGTSIGSLDDLELELRKLPGVRAAGFDDRDDVLLVQLHVTERERSDQPVPITASRIAARYCSRPVAVEIVRWRAPLASASAAAAAAAATVAEVPVPSAPVPGPTEERRARLLAVLAFPDTDELEVHLIIDGRRAIGRAEASRGLLGAVEATIDAARGLGAEIGHRAAWARALDETPDDDRVVVAVAVEVPGDDRIDYGLAAGASPIDAAARAALDALNRHLARAL